MQNGVLSLPGSDSMPVQMHEPKPPDPVGLTRLRRIAAYTILVGAVGTIVFLLVAIVRPGTQDALWMGCMASSLAALFGGVGLRRRRNWGRVILLALDVALLCLLAHVVYCVTWPRQINVPLDLDEVIAIIMGFFWICVGIRGMQFLWNVASMMEQ